MLQEIMCVSSLKEVYTAELEGRGVDESNSGALRVVRPNLGGNCLNHALAAAQEVLSCAKGEAGVAHEQNNTLSNPIHQKPMSFFLWL